MRERVDPELAAALAHIPRGPNGLFDFSDVPKLRAAVQAMVDAGAAAAPRDPSVAVEVLTARQSGSPDVGIRLFRPSGLRNPAPAILWFHGGGQVAGHADQEDAYLATLAKDVSCVVASVDYRLAPEAPPPAAAEDGLAAYCWMRDEAEAIGVDAARIGIAGASGGGCIAAALALMIRDRALPAPLFQALNYPMLDDRAATPSAHAVTQIGVVDRLSYIAAWDAVLGDRRGGSDVPPYAVPARARTLSGLPRTFIAVGDLDVVRDESVDYAVRLNASGTATELHVYDGAYHAWDLLAPEAELTSIFRQTWLHYLRRAFDK